MKSIRRKTKYAIYYINEYNVLHKIDGPSFEYPNGDKLWYINGLNYRIDGPSDEYSSGNKYWHIYSQAHRIDGPAAEYSSGNKHFYLFGKRYTETQHSYSIEHYDSLIDSNEYFGRIN